jgi:ATP-binding cassette subfamily C protein LapB
MAMQLVTIGVVVYGVHIMASDADNAPHLTVGALIAATILTGRTMAPLGQIAALLTRLNQAVVALKSLNQIMQLPVERGPDKRYLSRPDIKGTVEFRDVTFKYPGSDLASLSDVSFRIAPGERVGIIGPVGSGKTTIARMLLSFYEPTDGAVLLDGTDLRQIDPSDARRSIGAVMQDVTLFRASVRENIAMGAPQADDAMILGAAELAGVHDFISRHPLGYDLVVGEGGGTLSGGQKQSIALARALLPNPRILLLDEPTSAMDLNSERRFIGRLKTVIEDKTLVLITHRTSLLSLVDRIIILGNGKVVADGPREEVLKLGRTGRQQTLASVPGTRATTRPTGSGNGRK